MTKLERVEQLIEKSKDELSHLNYRLSCTIDTNYVKQLEEKIAIEELTLEMYHDLKNLYLATNR